MLSNTRAIVLGLLALLVVGVVASATASAEPGPFWHHRNNSTEGNGLKVELKSPETFSGTGGPQELKGTIGTTPVLLRTPGVKITGTIWNNGLQGQIKLELKYPPITIVEPKLSNCQAEAFTQPGAHNVVFAEGHLAWTWNGTEGQRTEQPIVNQKPDIIFVPPGTQIQQGATELPKGTFAEVKFAGGGCGVLAGVFPVNGTTIGSLKPENVGEWSRTLITNTPEGKAKQHFWNGKEFIGVETGLIFAKNASSLIGEDTVTSTTQEIAVFEK
jgi:hypothetical protein